jgi:hypothetical protein
MRAIAARRDAKEHDLVGRVLCHDIRGLFHKGHAVRVEDLPNLFDAVWDELHLIELAPEDVGQREAGQRLASALATTGLQSAPSGHRHVLKAMHDGLLEIDIAALQRLNSIAGMAVFTLCNGEVVSAGQVVLEAQITPLAIDRRSIDEAERIAGDIIRLLPFPPRDVIVWRRDDRIVAPLREKLRRFGSGISEVRDLPFNLLAAPPGPSLHIVSGSNALDPLDPTFVALERIGATMQRVGVPVHPGTLFWIATRGEMTIVGLPACGLGPRITAFDLILPKLLARGNVRDDELSALGHGGLLR